MYYVYILRSRPRGTLYVGTAKDVEKRLRQHNAGYSKSTKAFRPFELVHAEGFETLAAARKREWQLKCTPGGGKEKQRLAAGG
jgi:putative endonuclease